MSLELITPAVISESTSDDPELDELWRSIKISGGAGLGVLAGAILALVIKACG